MAEKALASEKEKLASMGLRLWFFQPTKSCPEGMRKKRLKSVQCALTATLFSRFIISIKRFSFQEAIIARHQGTEALLAPVLSFFIIYLRERRPP